QVGFPSYQIEVSVEAGDIDLDNFRKEKAVEDQQLALKTIEQQRKRDTEQKNGKRKQAIGLGQHIHDEPVMIETILEEENRLTIQGYIFSAEIRKLRSGRSLLMLKITDYSDSLEVKMFSRNDEDEIAFEQVKEGVWVKARGRVQTDLYTSQLTMMVNDINEVKVASRTDEAEEKRVELHAHTTMSQLDAVVSPKDLIKKAAEWGHEAIAITDHSGVQAFPEAFYASLDHDIKVIYGVEAHLVNDGVPIAYNASDIVLKDETYVVFDVETTGLSAVYDTIIELAGVKIKDGEIIDTFESFANPHRQLPEVIKDITGITDDM